MKIKQVFAKEFVNNENVYVSINSNEFNGLLRANNTASFILDLLKDDISEADLLEKLLTKYKVELPKAEVAIQKVLQQLRELNLLVE